MVYSKKKKIIMITSFLRLLVLLLLVTSANQSVKAETINVEPGTDTIQAAMDAASNGDILQLAAGTYKGYVNFNGKALTLQGLGKTSVIKGDGNIATVIFDNDEGADSVIDQVYLTRGHRAGAILINSASPTIKRSWFIRNRAIGAGSAIYFFGRDSNGDSATVTNCVFTHNRTLSAQLGNIAHTLHLDDSDPTITNNTIIYNDRAGINISGNSNPVIRNNLLGYNGRIKSKGKKKRGRGILVSFADGIAGGDIQYNLFYKNKRADFGFGTSVRVKPYTDVDAIAALNGFGSFALANNLEGDPLLVKRKKAKDITLRAGSLAIDAGDPDSAFNDVDASANDIGATGGPSPIEI